MPTSITSSGITFDDATTQTTSATKAGGIGTAQLANAAVTPAKLSQPYTLATAVASTSGTSIDFTGIPSWAKRITVMFDGVSTNGTSHLLLQLGDSEGVENTGYISTSGFVNSSTQVATDSVAGFIIWSGVATNVLRGSFTLNRISAELFVGSGVLSTYPSFICASGSKATSGTLDRVRITTVNGTDTFDAGTINISYEG